MADVRMVPSQQPRSIATLMRRRAPARTRAATTPRAADSVGVASPEYMEPITTMKIPNGGSRSLRVDLRPSQLVLAGRPPQLGRNMQAMITVTMNRTAIINPGTNAAR